MDQAPAPHRDPFPRLAILEAHFHALCRAVHHGVFLTEPGGALTHASERLRAMLGDLPEAELSIESLTAAVHPEERRRVQAEWLAAVAAGEPFSSEHRVRGAGGREAVVRVYATPVESEHGLAGYVGTVEDVTRLKSVEEQLLESQRRLETITDNVPAAISYIGIDERFHYVNGAFEAAYGRSRETVLGRKLEEVVDADGFGQIRKMIEAVHAPGSGDRASAERCIRRGGDTIWLQTAGVLHRSPSGDPLGYFVLSTDITSRRQAEESLFREKERALVTLGSITDAVATVSATGVIEYLNPTAERVTGWTLEAARGQPAEAVLVLQAQSAGAVLAHPLRAALAPGFEAAAAPMAAIVVTRQGEAIPIDLSVAAIHGRSGEPEGAVAIFRDATAQRRLARRLAFQATHDALTGLRNRRGLAEALEAALVPGTTNALLFLDLDRFKAVNDACGHAAGDELLREVARALDNQVRSGDTVGRLGGDEFVVLLADCAPEDAPRVAEQIRAAIEGIRFLRDGREHRIGVSIGLARADAAPGATAQVLLEAADAACYAAKSAGRNRVVALTPRRAA